MPCPTHSAPSAGCVIGTGRDVSVDDSRRVQPVAVRQENTADSLLVQIYGNTVCNEKKEITSLKVMYVLAVELRMILRNI